MSVRLFKSLLYKSTKIQQEIDQEHKRPWPDPFRLLKLKKIRLSIKDRLQRLIAKHKSVFVNSTTDFHAVRIKNN